MSKHRSNIHQLLFVGTAGLAGLLLNPGAASDVSAAPRPERASQPPVAASQSQRKSRLSGYRQAEVKLKAFYRAHQRELGSPVVRANQRQRDGSFKLAIGKGPQHRIRSRLTLPTQANRGDAKLVLDNETAGIATTFEVSEYATKVTVEVRGKALAVKLLPDGRFRIGKRTHRGINGAANALAAEGVFKAIPPETKLALLEFLDAVLEADREHHRYSSTTVRVELQSLVVLGRVYAEAVAKVMKNK